MSKDLVERLQDHVIHLDAWGKEAIPDADLVEEAADRIEKLEAALREMLEKCTWAKREKWCGSLDCHCQIARKALEGKDD